MGYRKERQAIISAYGPSWGKRVDKMSDQQVIAIYFRLKEKGKLK